MFKQHLGGKYVGLQFQTRFLLISLVLSIFVNVHKEANSAPGFTAPEPEDLMIYQIFIDRFNNGDSSNDNANPRSTFNPTGPTSFHGGDLEGIRQQLSYIRGMGFNGIWMTPFIENVRDYHGYGVYNWFNVDPNFGDLAKMQQLINEANALGIAIYFDMVAGHCGDIIDSTDFGYGSYLAPPSEYNLRWRTGLQYPPPFNSLTHFHAHGTIGNFVAPEQELGELSGLDDLKTDTQYVRDQMFLIWQYWVQNTGVSGFRVDTVKHVDIGFWEDFLPKMDDEMTTQGRTNYFTFGEIFGANDSLMDDYIGTLSGGPYKFDSAVDFQFYFNSNSVFATASSPPSNIINRLLAREFNLPGHHLKMPNFIDNHDVRRFMNVTNDNPANLGERLRRLELALTFLYCAPGPPIVYYGTEQAFDGGNDPFNREDMWDGQFESGPSVGNNFDPASTQYQLIKRLGLIREQLSPFRRGDFVSKSAETVGAGHLAFTRTSNSETVLVIMNTGNFSEFLPSITVTELANQTIVNALDSQTTMTVPASGILTSRFLDPQTAEIWMLESSLPNFPPSVTDFDPADSEVGVSVNLPEIIIQFSTEMNRSVTEAAISTNPALAYTTLWNAGSTEVRLQLAGALNGETNYSVTVGATAESASGTSIGLQSSATWLTDRTPPVLPPFPPALHSMGLSNITFLMDGNDNEWPAAPAIADNTSMIVGDQTFFYQDAAFDDTGDGSYTYPTNVAFTGGDADLSEFRFAYDINNFYFVFNPVSINPGASFYTAYFGVGIDTGVSSGQSRSIGFDQGGNNSGIAEALIRSDADLDFEMVFTGPRGASLLDAFGNEIATLPSGFSQATGLVEVAVPRSLLGLSAALNSQPLNLFVYTGLETFGSTREITVSNSTWDPGGGITEVTDPDIFDLAGASLSDQQDDLSDYTQNFQSTIIHSVLPLSLTDTIPVELSEFRLY